MLNVQGTGPPSSWRPSDFRGYFGHSRSDL